VGGQAPDRRSSAASRVRITGTVASPFSVASARRRRGSSTPQPRHRYATSHVTAGRAPVPILVVPRRGHEPARAVAPRGPRQDRAALPTTARRRKTRRKQPDPAQQACQHGTARAEGGWTARTPAHPTCPAIQRHGHAPRTAYACGYSSGSGHDNPAFQTSRTRPNCPEALEQTVTPFQGLRRSAPDLLQTGRTTGTPTIPQRSSPDAKYPA
jgi:hypothetical protein